jgi:hypothetical protein
MGLNGFCKLAHVYEKFNHSTYIYWRLATFARATSPIWNKLGFVLLCFRCIARALYYLYLIIKKISFPWFGPSQCAFVQHCFTSVFSSLRMEKKPDLIRVLCYLDWSVWVVPVKKNIPDRIRSPFSKSRTRSLGFISATISYHDTSRGPWIASLWPDIESFPASPAGRVATAPSILARGRHTESSARIAEGNVADEEHWVLRR